MFKDVKACRCCGGNKLYRYLDLGKQPLANSYHKGEELKQFPLQVDLCESCFHSQLSIVVDPPLMFKNYLYVSGTTETFRKHCKDLAHDAVNYWNARHPFLTIDCWMPPYVLDVACNDGTLLGNFKDMGCSVQGVDPAQNLREITKEKDIPVEVIYWGSGAAYKLRDKKFDIITGTNVFAHVHDVSTYLDECISVLKDDGVIILEFPYCDEMISHFEFDTIYHEHLSYFLVNSMIALVERKKLGIDRIMRTPIHGGSIRFFLRRDKHHCTDALDLAMQEHKRGLLSKQTYVDFAKQVQQNKKDMQKLISDLKGQGKKVIGYGASAKGNTMLNFFELNLDYIVDDNPMKWDYLTPGRDIPIKSPEVMKEESELYIVILAWNFFDEIVNRIGAMCGERHHYIKYVPAVSCT